MKLRDSLAENNSILLQAEASTWQEAVKLSVDLLVKANVVEPRYYQAILDGVAQYGPYFVIARGWLCRMAVRKKASRTGFALVTLKSHWCSTTKITNRWMFITMAAVDANTHREVGIMQIVNLFEDQANFDRLRACRTAQDVLDLIDLPLRRPGTRN
ncbi:PTS ascorbate transporter subunit IIA [Shigella flexneri]